MKIWLNGCFDVLHHGHFRLLRHAKLLGDEVVVGIDSDRRVKELKGSDRPHHTLDQRKFNLHQIEGVRKVVDFDSDEDLIWHIRNEEPDAMLIGSDYRDKPIVGEEYLKEIIYFDRITGFSTTKILDNE